MKVSELIHKLELYRNELGDVDVLVTDGYDCRCYRGEYDVHPWQDEDDKWYIDIGIGGTLE